MNRNRCGQCPPNYESSTEAWSESKQIFYYSRFDLFEGKEETTLYQYSLFWQAISTELGKEWQRQAQLLFTPYFHAHDIFMNLLQAWLQHHHRSLNTHRPRLVTFSSLFIDLFMTQVQKDFTLKWACKNQKGSKTPNTFLTLPSPSPTALKAVCMGFFMTSNQIWEEMFQTPPPPSKGLFSLVRDVTTTIQSTFRPLMVVTQKISNMFGRKKRKLNQCTNISSNKNTTSVEEEKFQDCFHAFVHTLSAQKVLQQKMSAVCLQPNSEVSKVIEKTTFGEEESPVRHRLLSEVYDYVTGFLQRQHSWQVASNFVTHILELNAVALQDNKKVKVLRPAQDFYHRLVIVWLLFCKANPRQTLTFDDYLERLKATYFADDWMDKYRIPVKYFYQKMIEHWEEGTHLGEQQLLGEFINRVKHSMENDWHQRIRIQKQTE